tara:strand:+ start:2101 stop:3072 length:972 start_codon:yes stop_codon:yes gene_type:complete
MKTSDKIDKLAPALVNAQSEVKPPEKNQTYVNKKRGYSDLEAISRACQPALNRNGIASTFSYAVEEAREVCLLRLTHTSGQWQETSFPISHGEWKRLGSPMQEAGSCFTYARKNLLLAALGVAPSDDKDLDSFPLPDDKQWGGRGWNDRPPRQSKPPQVQQANERGIGEVTPVSDKDLPERIRGLSPCADKGIPIYRKALGLPPIEKASPLNRGKFFSRMHPAALELRLIDLLGSGALPAGDLLSAARQEAAMSYNTWKSNGAHHQSEALIQLRKEVGQIDRCNDVVLLCALADLLAPSISQITESIRPEGEDDVDVDEVIPF